MLPPFFSYGSCYHHLLHSFPTRRSSDLLIEHAERFGLAQLHQLRGRVGRGTAASHCILLSDSGEAAPRLQAFTETTDRSEEHTSELQSHSDLVCRLLLEKKKTNLQKAEH